MQDPRMLNREPDEGTILPEMRTHSSLNLETVWGLLSLSFKKTRPDLRALWEELACALDLQEKAPWQCHLLQNASSAQGLGRKVESLREVSARPSNLSPAAARLVLSGSGQGGSLSVVEPVTEAVL